MKKHTTKHWLSQLKPAIAKQAIANLKKECKFEHQSTIAVLRNKRLSLKGALMGAFVFEQTRQGHEYWWNIATNAELYTKKTKRYTTDVFMIFTMRKNKQKKSPTWKNSQY